MKLIAIIISIAILLFCPFYARAYVPPNKAPGIFVKVFKASGLRVMPKLIFDLNMSNNASSNWGRNTVTLNLGLFMAAKSEAEIAFIIGHEMGHLVMRSTGRATRCELMADQYGLKFAQGAGYSRCQGAQILKTFVGGDGIHPTGKYRYNLTGCA